MNTLLVTYYLVALLTVIAICAVVYLYLKIKTDMVIDQVMKKVLPQFFPPAEKEILTNEGPIDLPEPFASSEHRKPTLEKSPFIVTWYVIEHMGQFLIRDSVHTNKIEWLSGINPDCVFSSRDEAQFYINKYQLGNYVVTPLRILWERDE